MVLRNRHCRQFVPASSLPAYREFLLPRLFIAVNIPEELRLTLKQMLPADSGLSPTTLENLHLTLHFLGQVSESDADVLSRTLHSGGMHAFELSLQGTGCFHISETRGVLWCGVDASPDLMNLHQMLADQLQSLGIRIEDRPYVPHITLARFDPRRFTDTEHFRQQHQKFTARFPVRQFLLYESVPYPQGSRYRVRGTYCFVKP